VLAVFPVVPQTFFLTEITKQKLIFEADSGAMTAALVANFDILELEMDYNLDLYRRTPGSTA
jgi:hypothetical protein